MSAPLSVKPIIDACVFHEWASSAELLPFLSAGWRDLVAPPNTGLRPLAVTPNRIYEDPIGDKADSAYPKDGVPGSDPDLLIEQIFASGIRDRVVLALERGNDVGAFAHVQAALAFIQAVNDWNLANWLERDRIYGLVHIVSQVPAAAAAEIRRIGTHPKIVGVAMGANGMSRLYGHPAYHPIYEAAADLGLPIVIQTGTEASASSVLPPVAGGMPATYTEYRMMRSHSMQSHLVSLITEGVLGRFPDLKVLLVGPGAMWLPSYLWRLNYYHKRHHELPWLRQLPSEIFRGRVCIATNSLENPRESEHLSRVLGTLPWVQECLAYASGYPNADYEEPDVQAARLPAEWHEPVFRGNALAFFRWPGAAEQRSATAAMATV